MRRLAAGVLLALALLAGSARADDAAPLPVPPAQGPSAQNFSITIQVLWQVQQGCKRYCNGSIQIQDAAQRATTLQITAATVPTSGTPNAATGTSATIQVIVQTQLGCVAFCSGTTRLQSAVQQANVTQLASAISAAVASAGNSSAVTQLVWQYQDICEVECRDVSALQIATQDQSVVQVATAGATPAPTLEAFMRWLAGIAVTATVDVALQFDQAGCLEHCAGDVQVQVSVQDDAAAKRSRSHDPVVAPPTVVVTAPVVPNPATGTASVAPARAVRTSRHRAVHRKHRGRVRVVPLRCGWRRNDTRRHRNIRLTMGRRSMLASTTTEGMRCGS